MKAPAWLFAPRFSRLEFYACGLLAIHYLQGMIGTAWFLALIVLVVIASALGAARLDSGAAS